MEVLAAMVSKKGDGEAEISNADQQTVIVNTLENWLKKLK